MPASGKTNRKTPGAVKTHRSSGTRRTKVPNSQRKGPVLDATGTRAYDPAPRHRSRQHAHEGGGFYSERQRKFLWARYPLVARKWAHNAQSAKVDWIPKPGWNRAGSSIRWRIDGRRLSKDPAAVKRRRKKQPAQK